MDHDRSVPGLSSQGGGHLRHAFRLAGQARPPTAGLDLSCRSVLDRAAEPVAVVGPALEAEGAVPHEGCWAGGAA